MAAAAGASAQSIFGLDYLGEHRFAGSARERALGFSLFAAPDTNSALTANAATLSGLTRLTFSFFEMLGASTVRSADLSAHENRFELPSVMVAVPLRPGLVAGVGYRTRFAGKGEFTYEVPIEDTPTAYETYRHRGSLFTAPITLSWAATCWLSVAGQLNIERGAIDDNVSSKFHEDNYATMESKRTRSFSGTSWEASALLRVVPRLFVGGSVNGPIDYGVTEDFVYTRSDLDSTAAFDLTLPLSYGVGVCAGASERWWLSARYWQRGAPEPDGFPRFAGALGDERLLAFGLERRGAASGGFWTRIPIRLGFYEDRWHIEVPAGSPVKSRFFTLGTGFKLPGGPGMLDLSLEAGQIGSKDENGVDERLVRIGVGISAGEAWSKRKPQQ